MDPLTEEYGYEVDLNFVKKAGFDVLLDRLGFNILDFALDRIWRRVPTLASTLTIVVDHGEV
ncbi:MAG TPA: hypothetical protein VGR25_08510 [bacterium]|nr:hypothetical protein [bacterium]